MSQPSPVFSRRAEPFNPDLTHSSVSWPLFLAAGLAFCATLFFIQNNDFPFGVHLDEVKKVRFILTGEQDFMHPILMLQVSRIANMLAGFSDPQDVVQLGRTMSAVFGGIYVFATYLLARRSLSHLEALIVAAAVAVVPLTAFHAQALKEDIYAAACLMLSLAALVRLAEKPDRAGGLLFGLAAGLALSSKFVAALIVVVTLLVPFTCRIEDARKFWKMLALAAGVAAAVVLTVNAPALFRPDVLASGVSYEWKHVAEGHGGVFVTPFKTYFMHYAREGLIKGLGAPLAITGLIGMVFAATRWKEIGNALRIPLLFGAVWYFAHELAPMKPGVSRYMVPLGAIVALFAVFLVREGLMRLRPAYKGGIAVAAIVFLLIVWPASKTFAYFVLSENDTSLAAKRFSEALGGKVFLDRGVWHPPNGNLDALAFEKDSAGTAIDELKAEWDYAVTRNLTGTRVTSDEARQNATRRFYASFYRHGYIEIEHTWREYEFRNRRIRIIALRGNGAEMEALANTWTWPGTVRVKFVPGVTE